MNAATHRVRDWALRHLARPRPAQDFVPQIDGLRCVAIVAVVLFRRSGRRLSGLLANLAAGACLLLGVRAALVGADWPVVALWIGLSLPFHLADLAARWRG